MSSSGDRRLNFGLSLCSKFSGLNPSLRPDLRPDQEFLAVAAGAVCFLIHLISYKTYWIPLCVNAALQTTYYFFSHFVSSDISTYFSSVWKKITALLLNLYLEKVGCFQLVLLLWKGAEFTPQKRERNGKMIQGFLFRIGILKVRKVFMVWLIKGREQPFMFDTLE